MLHDLNNSLIFLFLDFWPCYGILNASDNWSYLFVAPNKNTWCKGCVKNLHLSLAYSFKNSFFVRCNVFYLNPFSLVIDFLICHNVSLTLIISFTHFLSCMNVIFSEDHLGTGVEGADFDSSEVEVIVCSVL